MNEKDKLRISVFRCEWALPRHRPGDAVLAGGGRCAMLAPACVLAHSTTHPCARKTTQITHTAGPQPPIRKLLSPPPAPSSQLAPRSNNHIYAQVINDLEGTTLASASSRSLEDGGSNKAAAFEVGKALAEAAKAKGVTNLYFDRESANHKYMYHGRVASLIDGVREGTEITADADADATTAAVATNAATAATSHRPCPRRRFVPVMVVVHPRLGIRPPLDPPPRKRRRHRALSLQHLA